MDYMAMQAISFYKNSYVGIKMVSEDLNNFMRQHSLLLDLAVPDPSRESAAEQRSFFETIAPLIEPMPQGLAHDNYVFT